MQEDDWAPDEEILEAEEVEHSFGNSPKQELLLSYLVGAPEALAVCRPIIEHNFFDKELRSAVKFIIEHSDKYHGPPSIAMIEAETGVRLGRIEDGDDRRRIAWVCDEMERFCRLQKTIEAVVAASEQLMGEGDASGIVDPIKEAVLLSLQRDLGTDYFKDPAGRLKSMLDNSTVPTGFKDIDEVLYGGVEQGGVNILAASSGGGKSFGLANLGVNYLEMGKSVVYISLELSESRVAYRLDSMVSGIGSRQIFSSIDKVDEVVRMRAKKMGACWVKYMTTESTITDIEAYLRELELQTGKYPEVLLVDYLDLLSPKARVGDLGNLWVKDKYVTEELRALAMERGLICWTASQLNRSAVDASSHSQAMISGGMSKINTADNVISIRQDEALREKSMYMLEFLKTRNSAGVGKKVFLQANPTTMRFSDIGDRNSSDDSSEETRPIRRAPPKPGSPLDKIRKLRDRG